ncbi:MAG TPA: ABC transporter ATP-binding protein [Chloroflexota bacterium]
MAGGIKLQARQLRVDFYTEAKKEWLTAVEGLDLEVRDGEFLSVVGPSGCGKTTFLNVAGGLLEASDGSLTLDGREIRGPGRERAMVFQSPLLLPWRSVEKNITYGLECQGVKRAQAEGRARHYLELVGLDGFERHYPHQLSGGMQQRANLARALAVEPELLLMDEPFASLDAQTREVMQLELLEIWAQARRTVLFITHQIDEAIYLADRVAVFSARPGRVKEVVTIDLPRPRPLELKRDPRFVAYEEHIWDLIKTDVTQAMKDERESCGLPAAVAAGE